MLSGLELEAGEHLQDARRADARHRTEAVGADERAGCVVGQVDDGVVAERLELHVVRDRVELRVIERVERVHAEREPTPRAEPEALLDRQVDVVDRRPVQVVAARLEPEAPHRRLPVDAERDLLVRIARVVAGARIAADDRTVGVLGVRAGDVGLGADAVDAPGQAVGQPALEPVAARDLPVVDQPAEEQAPHLRAAAAGRPS